MLVSGSRAGVMALCVTLLMLLKIKPVRIVAIIILVTAILFAIRPASAIGRILIWAIVLRCFENGNLIIGNGPYSFTASYMETQASFLSSHESLLLSQIAGNVNHSFNEILELLLSFGLIGIFLFAISVLYLIRFHRNEGLAAVAPVFVVSLFSYPTQYPFVLLSICLFLTYALHSSGEYREINLNGLRFNLIPLLLSVLLFFFVAKDERFDRLWFRAAMRTEYSKQQYTSLMKEWNGNPLFLYNYAMVQKQDGNYEYAKRLLLHCCKYIKDYDVIMELAEIESSLGFVKEAIDYYCLASKMVPHKYKPKYEMMQLYCSQGDTRVARKIANDIISSPEKVQSSQVDHYKAIAREYLEKELN